MTTSTILRRRVLRELRLELGPDAAAVDACVRNGEVSLTGSIRCYEDSQLADRAARRVRGVEIVIDQLVLAPAETNRPAR